MNELFDEHNRVNVDISACLQSNIDILEELFGCSGDVVKKPFIITRQGKPHKIYIIYIDGLTNNSMVEEAIIKPLSYEWRDGCETNLFDAILYMEAQTVDIKEEVSFDAVVLSILKVILRYLLMVFLSQ